MARHSKFVMRPPVDWQLEQRLTPASHFDLISRADMGTAVATGGGDSTLPDGFQSSTSARARLVSADGRFSVFTSDAANLVPGQIDSNNQNDVFLFDRVLNAVTLVSHVASNAQMAANGRSVGPVISGDGRYVAYISSGVDLINNFVNGHGSNYFGDIFLYDRVTGVNRLVTPSVSDPNRSGNAGSGQPDISADGRYVSFVSLSGDILTGQPPAAPSKTANVFLFDADLSTTKMVSHLPGKPAKGGNFDSIEPSISADGRFVAYHTDAGNLLPNGTDYQILLYDRVEDTNVLASHAAKSLAQPSNDFCTEASISGNGQYVVFKSFSTDLIPGFTAKNVTYNVYSFDRISGTVELLSNVVGNVDQGAGGSQPTISDDGRWIAFLGGPDLVAGYINGGPPDSNNVFIRDRMTGVTTLVSHIPSSSSTGGNASSYGCISGDGSRVVVSSLATDLVSGFVDKNGSNRRDVFVWDRASDGTTLISHALGSMTHGGAGDTTVSGEPVISADGKYIAFNSSAEDLVLDDRNRKQDVFIADASSATIQAASRREGPWSASANGPTTTITNQMSGTEGILSSSADGRFVAYLSDADNVVPGQIDPNKAGDVFLLDRQTQTTILVSRSVGTINVAGNAASTTPKISADGRYVVYSSVATDLISGFIDGNGVPLPSNGIVGSDVYLFDRVTGTNTLVSHHYAQATLGGDRTSAGAYGFAPLFLTISGDGRFVAYVSQATDLVENFVDNNGSIPNYSTGFDVFLFDRVTGINILVSHGFGQPTATGNNRSYAAIISRDGRYVVYETSATNISNVALSTLMMYDRLTGLNHFVDHAYTGPNAGPNGSSFNPHISTDGRYIQFQSNATNLVANYVGGPNQFYQLDQQTGFITLISHAATASAVGTNYPVEYATMNDDGSVVTYTAFATNLVSGFVDGNTLSYPDVYVWDRATNSTTLVSRNISGPERGGNGICTNAIVSGDGRFVAFSSQSSDLVPGFTENGVTGYDQDSFLFDRLTGATTLISKSLGATTNAGANGGAAAVAINSDGSVIALFGSANNLVTGDHNGFSDYFAYVNVATVQSVIVGDPGAPIQRSMIKSMTIAFDQFVPFAGDPTLAFELKRVGTAETISVNASVVYGATTTVTLTFSGPGVEFGSLIDGKYTLTVKSGGANGITNLDGNNDGFAGDDYTFNFHRLFGDADGNGTVNTVDFSALRTAVGGSSFIFDFNNTGSVDTADFNQFRSRFGASV